MSRVGWIILSAILLVFAAFASMTHFGGAPRLTRPGTSRPLPVAPAAGRLTVPVQGVTRAALVDSWGDARSGGLRQHHGTDIMAPHGTPVLAAAAGRVEKLFESALGGTTLYLRSADGHWIYYYAHLAGYAPGVHEGQAVRAGEHLGFVGDTGDAGAGNDHLHFGMQRMHPGQRWWQGDDVDPYPQLAGTRPSR